MPILSTLFDQKRRSYYPVCIGRESFVREGLFSPSISHAASPRTFRRKVALVSPPSARAETFVIPPIPPFSFFFSDKEEERAGCDDITLNSHVVLSSVNLSHWTFLWLQLQSRACTGNGTLYNECVQSGHQNWIPTAAGALPKVTERNVGRHGFRERPERAAKPNGEPRFPRPALK